MMNSLKYMFYLREGQKVPEELPSAKDLQEETDVSAPDSPMEVAGGLLPLK